MVEAIMVLLVSILIVLISIMIIALKVVSKGITTVEIVLDKELLNQKEGDKDETN